MHTADHLHPVHAIEPDYKRLKKLLRHLTAEEQDEDTLREHERIFREDLEVKREYFFRGMLVAGERGERSCGHECMRMHLYMGVRACIVRLWSPGTGWRAGKRALILRAILDNELGTNGLVQ